MNELKVLLGILAWIALHLATTKDDNEKGFKFKAYIKRSWDNWLVTFIGGFVVYYGFPFLWSAYFHYKKLPVPELVPFYATISGFVGGSILQALWGLKKKFIK